MPQENNSPSYMSQTYLSYDNICTLTQDFLKIEKAFKCALFM